MSERNGQPSDVLRSIGANETGFALAINAFFLLPRLHGRLNLVGHYSKTPEERKISRPFGFFSTLARAVVSENLFRLRMPGWTAAAADPATGHMKARETSGRFRFTDDIVIRAAGEATESPSAIHSEERSGTPRLRRQCQPDPTCMEQR
jgi:hypothetical protein